MQCSAFTTKLIQKRNESDQTRLFDSVYFILRVVEKSWRNRSKHLRKKIINAKKQKHKANDNQDY